MTLHLLGQTKIVVNHEVNLMQSGSELSFVVHVDLL